MGTGSTRNGRGSSWASSRSCRKADPYPSGVLRSAPPPNRQNNEDRWYSTSPYGGLTWNNLHLQGNHNATGQGGTCFGDSGGPHFWQTSLVLVAVTSWGDAICRSLDMTQRTDLPSVLNWLEDEFEVTPPP